MRRGQNVDIAIRDKCVLLLRTTDLSITLIAERLAASTSWVWKINHDFKVREYTGRKTFLIGTEAHEHAWT